MGAKEAHASCLIPFKELCLQSHPTTSVYISLGTLGCKGA